MSVAVRQHGQPPPEGLLPGYQPTTLKFIVNRLSRHKVSTFAFTILSVEPADTPHLTDRSGYGIIYGITRVPLKTALKRENEIAASDTRKADEAGLAPG